VPNRNIGYAIICIIVAYYNAVPNRNIEYAIYILQYCIILAYYNDSANLPTAPMSCNDNKKNS
jgi:hypothetical protein